MDQDREDREGDEQQDHGHAHVHAGPVVAKLRWTDVALWAAVVLDGVGTTASRLAHLAASDIAAHHNYLVERERFAASAAAELETITTGPGEQP